MRRPSTYDLVSAWKSTIQNSEADWDNLGVTVKAFKYNHFIEGRMQHMHHLGSSTNARPRMQITSLPLWNIASATMTG